MTQIQLRRGTASEWTAANPVLAAGEVGVIGTTGDFKIGDGATTWNLLPAQSSRYVSRATPLVLLVDSPQTFTTSAPADITWTAAEVSDPDGWAAVGASQVTVPAGKGGRYTISYMGTWSGAPGTTPALALNLNGANVIECASTTGIYVYSHILTVVRTLAAGDIIKFSAYQNSGSNKDLNSRLEIS